jgi:hypothetical protein
LLIPLIPIKLLLTLFDQSIHLSPKIILNQSIIIKALPEMIFDYVSNLNNDPLWRSEVAKMELLDEGKLGTVVIEYITVYKFFHMTTPVEVLKMNRPMEFEIESLNTHPYWVHCRRTIEKVDEEHSKISVQLSFTLDNLKQAFPVLPPKQMVYHWYNPRMKRYLKKLKKILEK